MGKCETCQWWGKDHPTASDGFFLDGDDMVKSCGCPKTIYLNRGEMQIDGLGYMDSEGYRAALQVGMDFGCIHYEARRTVQTVYILYDVGSDEIPQVIECFSTREKAEDYEKTQSHKWTDEYKIEAYELDPIAKQGE